MVGAKIYMVCASYPGKEWMAALQQDVLLHPPIRHCGHHLPHQLHHQHFPQDHQGIYFTQNNSLHDQL